METDDNMSLRVASFAYYLDTAKENLMHRVSAQETPLPLSSAKTNTPTIKPPFSIKFSKSKDTQDTTNLRVDSFSYNLNTAGDNNFVFEVPGPIQDPTSAFSFSQEIPRDGEIGVFNADKYFNMKLEYQTEVNKHSYKNHEEPSNIRQRAPSLCSEASSWNSQSTLLPHLQRSECLMKQKKAIGRRIFTGFGCRGPCFDKKSVHINEIVAQGAYYSSKPSRIGSERIDHHLALLPTVSSDLGGEDHLAVKKQLMKVEDLDDSRRSIEVFGSGNSSKGSDVATNMERKLSMLTWDAIPKGRALPTSTLGSTTICDDMASDASSDLFEIENISGSIYPLTSEPPDDMSSCMSPTSLYAPSEASIQWSVVTASAADYSVAPDYNDETSVSVAGDVISRKIMSNRSSKTRTEGGKEVQKSRQGGLLGCKSHKAVDVAENVCLKSTNEKVKNQARTRSFTNGGLSSP